MHIVAVSDLHGNLPEIPECSLLLVAGDLCPNKDHSVEFQKEWIHFEFRRWLEKAPAKKKIFIAGNHDFFFEHKRFYAPRDFPAEYLQDESTEYEGLKIFGSPWTPVWGWWAFNAHESFLYERWAKIPNDTDIIITHGPPKGYCDLNSDKEHVGSPTLAERIRVIQPKLVVFGHIHEARGTTQTGKTLIANVSLVNSDYSPVYGIWEWEI